MVVMGSPPGWTPEIFTLGWVVDAAGVFFVRRKMDAAVSMKAV
jgi:hypothetical protein